MIERPGEYSLRAPAAHHDPDPAHGEAEGTSTTVFGFWVYLMSDCVLFGTLFAVYAVLAPNVAGGPTAAELFELPFVLVETFLLLISSVTFGYGMLAARADRRGAALAWLAVTFAFGAGFLGMELHEFGKFIAEGAGPQRSAFLSGFFALVGTHGLHVASGLVWITVMMTQIVLFGIGETVLRRLMCLSLFWHFLDVVWICVFTIVYLLGALNHA